MIDASDTETPLRNSVPESLRVFLESLENEVEEFVSGRRRKLDKDPDADVAGYDRSIRDLNLRIEATRHVCEAYVQLEMARDATKGQSNATTRVELSELLLRIDKFFAKRA